jgi:predicted RNase H-like nuclease (RuvC/YqgF family)
MIRLLKIGCCPVILLLAVFSAQSQTLDDWKAALSAAQSNRGCESIPYSNYRDECTRKSEKVEEHCKTDKWSCQGLETKKLRENITGLTEKIERLKSDKDRLNDQKSRATTDDEKKELGNKIDQIEKEIYERSKDLDFMKKSLETDLSDIELRLYKGGQCIDARTDVQKSFENAVSDGDRESSPEIKAIAKDLIDYWRRKRDEHEKAFQDTKQGIENCKKCKSGDM